MDRTPLHAASERGQVDVVRMLALHGAGLKVRHAACQAVTCCRLLTGPSICAGG